MHYDLTTLSDDKIAILDHARIGLVKNGALFCNSFCSGREDGMDGDECRAFLCEVLRGFGCEIGGPPHLVAQISTHVRDHSFSEWREIQRADLKREQEAAIKEKTAQAKQLRKANRMQKITIVIGILGLLGTAIAVIKYFEGE